MARRRASASKRRIDLGYERDFWEQERLAVVGVDEAGRGPLAGPVVAAAVVLPEGVGVAGADDSKRVPRRERAGLAEHIRELASAVAVGAASVREIDRVNILCATARAMDRAIRRLPPRPRHIVVDGLPLRALPWDHDAVVGGDRRVHSIACASIVAKVCRDRLMTLLARRYPEYGWEQNMGYGTPRHRAAIRRYGLTPHHRRSFGLVQLELPFAEAAPIAEGDSP